MKINSIEHFELDLDIYHSIFKQSPRLMKNVEEFKKDLYGFDKLSEDIYLSLFKAEPKTEQSDVMDVRYMLNGMIVKNLISSDDIELLRKQTSLDYFNSVLGSEILSESLVSNYNKLIAKHKDFDIMVREYKQAIRNYLDMEKNNDATEEKKAILLKSIDQKIEQVELRMQRDNLFSKSINHTYTELMSITNTIRFWGLDDGKLNSSSYEEKIAVAKELRRFKNINKLSEMVGRFRASASNLQKKKTKEEGQEIYGVELGNEIHKVLPSEKMYLANAKTKKSFYKKYYQKELLSYKQKNNKVSSKGPIICCIDTSTSMEGDLEVWSKSVAMALLDIAYKQKREFVAVLFSYKVGDVIEFNKNKVEPKKIYNLATSFYGSGTNFIEPLTESLKLIGKSRYKYADIVFITDGQAPLDEEFIEYFNKQKKEKEFRMITVNVSDKIEKALDRINDTQMLLSDLTDETVEKTNEKLFTI